MIQQHGLRQADSNKPPSELYHYYLIYYLCKWNENSFRNTHGRDVKMDSRELLWILNNVLKLIRVKLTVYIQYSGEILV